MTTAVGVGAGAGAGVGVGVLTPAETVVKLQLESELSDVPAAFAACTPVVIVAV